jgi:flagella basal body P-ring formation protein FlgA
LRTGAAPARLTSAEVDAAAPMVVTLARSVAKGVVLTTEDVTLAPAGARIPDGIFTDPDDVIGRRTRAAIGEGRAVLLRQLEPDWMVAKGNPVVLVASAGGLSVSAPAEALEDGGMGDVIRVLNLSSQREVKVVVTGQNSVMAQTNMR